MRIAAMYLRRRMEATNNPVFSRDPISIAMAAYRGPAARDDLYEAVVWEVFALVSDTAHGQNRRFKDF